MASKPKKPTAVAQRIADAVKKCLGDGDNDPIKMQGRPIDYEIGTVRICFGGAVIEEIDPKDLV